MTPPPPRSSELPWIKKTLTLFLAGNLFLSSAAVAGAFFPGLGTGKYFAVMLPLGMIGAPICLGSLGIIAAIERKP